MPPRAGQDDPNRRSGAPDQYMTLVRGLRLPDRPIPSRIKPSPGMV